jgi:hypothetical protein
LLLFQDIYFKRPFGLIVLVCGGKMSWTVKSMVRLAVRDRDFVLSAGSILSLTLGHFGVKTLAAVFQEPKQPETQTDPQMYLVIRLKVSRA